MIAATLSSALASFLGAPRISRHSLAMTSSSYSGPLRSGRAGNENPRRGVLLTAAIVLGVFATGDLNAIASCHFDVFPDLVRPPQLGDLRRGARSESGFRPKFRFLHSRLSLLEAWSVWWPCSLLTCLRA